PDIKHRRGRRKKSDEALEPIPLGKRGSLPVRDPFLCVAPVYPDDLFSRRSGLSRIQFFYELLEGNLEVWFVVVGVGVDELDDLAVAVRGRLVVASCLIDHAEPIVTVVHLRVTLDELSSHSLRLVDV